MCVKDPKILGQYELKVEEKNPSVSPSVCNPATSISCAMSMDFVHDVHTCKIGLDVVRE